MSMNRIQFQPSLSMSEFLKCLRSPGVRIVVA